MGGNNLVGLPRQTPDPKILQATIRPGGKPTKLPPTLYQISYTAIVTVLIRVIKIL